MHDFTNGLAAIFKDVGNGIHEEYYFKTLSMVKDLGSPELVDGSVPFEAWSGIAQAIADASGYRVVLQAALMQELKDNPGTFRVCENIDIAQAEPILFRTPAP